MTELKKDEAEQEQMPWGKGEQQTNPEFLQSCVNFSNKRNLREKGRTDGI